MLGPARVSLWPWLLSATIPKSYTNFWNVMYFIICKKLATSCIQAVEFTSSMSHRFCWTFFIQSTPPKNTISRVWVGMIPCPNLTNLKIEVLTKEATVHSGSPITLWQVLLWHGDGPVVDCWFDVVVSQTTWTRFFLCVIFWRVFEYTTQWWL